MSIYLDYAATTPIAPEVEAAMREVYARAWANPSSMHSEGQAARRAVDAARDVLAGVLRCRAGELVFTGGGTEADNLAIRGVMGRYARERGNHVVVTAVEHEAVLKTCEALRDRGEIQLTVIGCSRDGRTDAAAIADAVRPDTVLVTAMLVNNEVGAVNDVAAIAAAVKERNAQTLVHTDAVQALGRIAVDAGDLGVDLFSLSAHKVYGPKGVGALWRKTGVALTAQITGGGQERELRSGTENVAGIVGFGAAAERIEQRRESEMRRQGQLAQQLRDTISAHIPGVWIAPAENAVANIVTIAVPDMFSEVLVTALDRAGVCASGGSACSAGATRPSHVLAAMQVGERYQRGPLRFSLGEQTTAADIASAADALRAVVSAGQLAKTAR